MNDAFVIERHLTANGFGAALRFEGGAEQVVRAAEREPGALPALLAEARGLLLLPGMGAMAEDPALMLRLSRLFGAEVENYRETGMPLNLVHPTVPEIFVVSNTPPASKAPPRLPDPPLTADGKLPVQFPHRRGWHTDQSFRRPPPDASLFLAVVPVLQGQGQTLFADGTSAYESLSPAMKARIDGLEGLHVGSRANRSRQAVLAGEAPRQLGPQELPQRQPLARVHPVTGRKALYMCEFGQMDWLEGPIIGMETGPNGEGGKLLMELMSHMTQPAFVYAHEWTAGDLVIWDNRCTVHAATWFDADKESRVMWRTTISGNPGPEYAGEAKSWVAA